MLQLKNWVEREAGGCLPGLKSVYLERTASTNDEALEYCRSGGKGPFLVVAGEQSAGRGRLERKWESPPGKGLYFSLLLHPKLPSAQAPLIPLAVGLALKQGLAGWALPDLVLKWPNDLWAGKRKMAGILCELVGPGPRINAVVVGIGLNLTQRPEDFSSELRLMATSLWQVLNIDVSASALLHKIVSAIFAELAKLEELGPVVLARSWEQRSGMLGLQVKVREGNHETSGTTLGLTDGGQLRVRGADEKIIDVLSGDVFLI